MTTLMEELIKDKGELLRLPKTGDIVKGKVIGRSQASVFVDLGLLGIGIIFGKEFYQAKHILKKLQPGEEVFAKVVDPENEKGLRELSISEAEKEVAWTTLREKKDKGENLVLKILGANKGGLLAQVMGVNAFLPVSQLSSANYPRIEDADGNKILKELQKFVGQEMELKILDLDPREEKLILSEKIKETERIKDFLKNYKVGDIVEGEITGVVDFGAFVKFPADPNEKEDGGQDYLEGLIHISELDWQLIENPAEIVKTGDKVRLKIIDITENKVSLSLKALREDPWKNIEEKYQKGSVIKGKVTKFNPFGAFVEISPKVQGLCHVSEFGARSKMEESLKINDFYDFEILLLDPKEHRMLLHLAKIS